MLSFGLTLLKLWAALKQALTDDDTKSLLVTNIARGYLEYKQDRAKKSSRKDQKDRSPLTYNQNLYPNINYRHFLLESAYVIIKGGP